MTGRPAGAAGADRGAAELAAALQVLGAGEPRMLGYGDAPNPSSAPGRPGGDLESQVPAGVAPLRQLFARVCRPVATPDTQGAFYRDWRLTAIDGTTFDLPDTKANVEAFGRPPRSGRDEQDVGYPQLRMVGLVECGTHAVFDAAIGALRTGEQALARRVLVSLRPGMLLLADRGFYGVDLWCTAAATGADLLWRVRKDLVLPVVEQLPDGSYLTEIFDRSDIHHTRRGVPVRAVEYTIAGHEGVYRLITTILDPDKAPAAERELPVLALVGLCYVPRLIILR
ncbi:IS4 family transposase [Streptomyces chiangmaiensis]